MLRRQTRRKASRLTPLCLYPRDSCFLDGVLLAVLSPRVRARDPLKGRRKAELSQRQTVMRKSTSWCLTPKPVQVGFDALSALEV